MVVVLVMILGLDGLSNSTVALVSVRFTLMGCVDDFTAVMQLHMSMPT